VFVPAVMAPALVEPEPTRTEALKFSIDEPPVCATVTTYAWPGAYAVGKPLTVMVPPPEPWHELAQVPVVPGAPE
jgi:hypothetical protein